jgi:hypothetical protein
MSKKAFPEGMPTVYIIIILAKFIRAHFYLFHFLYPDFGMTLLKAKKQFIRLYKNKVISCKIINTKLSI